MNFLKTYLANKSIAFPKTAIALVVLLNIILISGIQHIVQDDDMVKLLPKDIESIVTFNDIREEFGNSEFMYIALGHEGSNAFNPELLKIVWEMSKSLEDYEPIEEVISIATANKIYFGQLDSSIIVEDLSAIDENSPAPRLKTTTRKYWFFSDEDENDKENDDYDDD